MGLKPSEAINSGPQMKLGCNNLFTHPHFAKYTLVFVFFYRFLPETLRNFTDYVTTPISFPECCETLWITQQGSSWLPECYRLSTSGTLQNFTDYLTMDVKHFDVVKQRSHVDKQWSPDEIRVWHTLLTKKAWNHLPYGLKDENEFENVLTYLEYDCNVEWSKNNLDK